MEAGGGWAGPGPQVARKTRRRGGRGGPDGAEEGGPQPRALRAGRPCPVPWPGSSSRLCRRQHRRGARGPPRPLRWKCPGPGERGPCSQPEGGAAAIAWWGLPSVSAASRSRGAGLRGGRGPGPGPAAGQTLCRRFVARAVCEGGRWSSRVSLQPWGWPLW